MRAALFTLVLFSLQLSSLPAQNSYPCLEALPLHIVVLGSSTAAGTGPSSPDSAWVNRYRVYLQDQNPAHQVTNLARGGYQTFNLMPDGFQPPSNKPAPDTLRNISAALDLDPDGIIINLPSNDAATGSDATVQMNNFRTMTQLAHQQGVPVWVCTTQPRVFGANQIAIQLATRDSIFAYYGDFAIDFWSGLADSVGLPLSQFDSGDGVHLNDAGHRLLIDRVIEANLPQTLAQPIPAPDYRISEFITEDFCAQSPHAFSFVIQNLGINSSVNWLLEMGLSGDPLLYFSELGTPLETCESDTLVFFADLAEGGEWDISGALRPANATGQIYDFLQRSLSLQSVETPQSLDTAICKDESLLLSLAYDSVHVYENEIASAPFSTSTSLTQTYPSDTTLWISQLAGPFEESDSLFTTDVYDRDWNGIMIDVIAHEDLRLDSLRLPLSVSGPQQLVIHYKSGSYKGSENTPQDWQVWDSTNVDVGQPGLIYSLDIQDFALNQGDTAGLYLQMEPPNARMRYLGVTSEINTQNGALELQTGTGISHTFGMRFYPRQINVELFYTQDKGYCESRRVPININVSQPEPDLGEDTTLTVGDSLLLFAPAGYGYQWSTGSIDSFIWVIPEETDTLGFWVSLQLTDSLGCTGTDSLFISVEQAVSIRENAALLPEIRYDASQEVAQVYWPDSPINELMLMDLQGKTLWRVFNQNPRIMLTYLSPGWYYVRVASQGRWHTLPLWVR